MIKIVDFLENYVKATKRGKCRACGKDVQWALCKLSAHKRNNCAGSTEAERILFRQQVSSPNDSTDRSSSEIKSPSQPSMFLKSVDTSGITQNSENIAEEILKVIDEIGAAKFISVVTDNAPVMRGAWNIIEERHPHISAFGCAAHVLNLLVKDILDPHSALLSECSKIIKFFNNHHRSRALYNTARQGHNSAKKLLVAVSTRWYSQYQSLKSVLDAKHVLKQVCEENTEELKMISTTAPTAVAIVNSSTFWTKLTSVLKLIEFPVQIIGKFGF